MLQKGSDHEKELQIKKNRLYESIKAVHGETNDELYALAGVQLEDYQAFQSFVLGILQVYDKTVSQGQFRSSYDFRSPALKLTFDFQHAVKISHQRLKSVAGTFSEHAAHNNLSTNDDNEDDDDESMKEILHGMLKEVSENADQLEEDMQQNMIIFSSDDGRVETVLKLGKDQNENVVTLVDQDNNEYVMMRPFDKTVIIEGIYLNIFIYDLAL
jgi:hypothetical protein